MSTVCGKKSEQPLEVSLKIENVPSVPKENGPSASASLAQLVGTPIGPLSIKLKDTDYKRDDGMFVGSFTNTSTLEGKLFSWEGYGKYRNSPTPLGPPLGSAPTLFVKLTLSGNLLSGYKLTGTMTGSQSTECPTVEVGEEISVELTKQ